MALHVKQEVAVGKVLEKTTVQNSISARLLDATNVLAENLAQSEPFLRFQESDRKLHADREAMQLLTEFAELQLKLRTRQPSGSITEGDIKRLRGLQRAISTNDVIQEQGLAQEKAVAFLREVKQEISNLLGIDFASLTRRSSGCC
jgi:cell fate (sporulation/competence/biofilm development) regulator YlbF (YheA/YmcA/DUF963 family)